MDHQQGKKSGFPVRLTKSLIYLQRSSSMDSIGYTPSFGLNWGLTKSKLLLGGEKSLNIDENSVRPTDEQSLAKHVSNSKGTMGPAFGSNSKIGGGGSQAGGSSLKLTQVIQGGGSVSNLKGGSSLLKPGSISNSDSKTSKKDGSGSELGVTNSPLQGLGSKSSSTEAGGSGPKKSSNKSSGPLGSGSNIKKGPSNRSGQFGEPTKSAIDAKKIADQEKDKEKIIPVCDPKTWIIDMDSLKEGVTVLDTSQGITIVGNASGLPPSPEPGQAKRFGSDGHGLKGIGSGGSFGSDIGNKSGVGSDYGKSPSSTGTVGEDGNSKFGSKQDIKSNDSSKPIGIPSKNPDDSVKPKPRANYQKKQRYQLLQDENPLNVCNNRKYSLVKTTHTQENQANGGVDPVNNEGVPNSDNLGMKSTDSLTKPSSLLRYSDEVAGSFHSGGGGGINPNKPNSKGPVDKTNNSWGINGEKSPSESKIPVATKHLSILSKGKGSGKSRSKNSKVSFGSMNGNVRGRSKGKSGPAPIIGQPFVEVDKRIPPDPESRLKLRVRGKAYDPNQVFFHSYYEVGPTRIWPAERAPQDFNKLYARPAWGRGIPAQAPAEKVQKRLEYAEKQKLKSYYKPRSQKIPFEALYVQGKCAPKTNLDLLPPPPVQKKVLTGVAPPDRFTFDINKHRAVKYFSGRKLVPGETDVGSSSGGVGNSLVLGEDSPEKRVRKIEKAMLPQRYYYVYRKECPPDRKTKPKPSKKPQAQDEAAADIEDDVIASFENEHEGGGGEENYEDSHGQYDELDFDGIPEKSIGGGSAGGSKKSQSQSSKSRKSSSIVSSYSEGASFGKESQDFGGQQNSNSNTKSISSGSKSTGKGSKYSSKSASLSSASKSYDTNPSTRSLKSESTNSKSAKSDQSGFTDEITFDFGPDDSDDDSVSSNKKGKK